ncbi:MAG TPA: cysteine--tRNA ligase [Flavobacteriales bacterium]|nr:cysteine--tRNA ligase [Flavobacteriales bacterium]HNK83951.1 cysteine--tRNA ligase [Flavobacteriales bacterium]HNM70583.1 cysteine--tRNA ligase [Flavobacteriales bacterium]HNO03900.1 cysteine--tRNA ligase [Flavobacteriales bacterium]
MSTIQKLPFHLTNTLTRKTEEFIPLNPPHVGLYVCGPTVYSDVHLGNVRSFTTFDVLYRWLSHIGYKVRYVRNITDVGHLVDDVDAGEDKIAKRARLEQLEPMEIVQKYTNGFHDVMRLFNVRNPSIEPTATAHLIEQIGMVQRIIDNGYAYVVNGSVYFDVPKFAAKHNYGELSGRRIDELLTNTRDTEGMDEKRSPLDFAIWKKAEAGHLMHWPSPWGEGFPGWHLECSVMSTKYLGMTFDIHGGGMDLKFPHHECEIAQSVAADGQAPVRYWMHGNMLTVNGRKMAKSEGNGFTPEELVTGNHKLLERGYSAMTVRFFMLQSHYASTLDFSNAALQAAEKGLEKMMAAVVTLAALKGGDGPASAEVAALEQACYDAMNDDLNTPIMIAHLFDGVRMINSANDGKLALSREDIARLNGLFNAMLFDVLGMRKEEEARGDDGALEGVMRLIIEMRSEAKATRNFALSDRIRDQLAAVGISIKDSKEGSTWDRK